MTLGTILFHNLVGLGWGWAFLSSWFLYNLFAYPVWCKRDK